MSEGVVKGPKPDVARIRKALTKIDAEPALWDQEYYATKTACGTALCIAGHIVVDAGYKITFNEDCDDGELRHLTDCGEDIGVLAANLASLTDRESECLFYSENTREDIQLVAEQIAARAGETL